MISQLEDGCSLCGEVFHLVNLEDETRHGLASLFLHQVLLWKHRGSVYKPTSRKCGRQGKNMYNVSSLEGTVKFHLLDCEPFRSDLLLLFLQKCIFLCTYLNDSNNRPGHLINLSVFYRALIHFHIKFGEDRKDNLKKYTLLQLLSRFLFPVTHTLMLFLALALKNSFYFSTVFLKILQYSNKHFIKLVRFTWALNREENLKVAGRLFESLWYQINVL